MNFHLPAHLAVIDVIVIAVYLIGNVAIGVYFSKYVDSAGDLFLAGRALPFWAVGMSIVVSDIGATDMISGAGAAYKFGISQANFDWIGSMPAMIVAAFVFVPYYWRSGVFTIPEFLGRRYNSVVQVVESLVWLLFLFATLSVMLWTAAVFFQRQLDWPALWGIWATAIFVGAYTIMGGLSAVVMTEVVQMVVMFVGAAALLFLAVWKAGGWWEMQETVLALGAEAQNHFRLMLPHDTPTPYPWTGIVFGLGIVMSTAYFVGNQAIIQRVLGARSEWDAKAGMIVGGVLKLLVPILIMVPGLAGRALHPELKVADDTVPLLIKELFPPGLMGLMFAAFLSALMCNTSSYLHSASTLFMSDLFGKAYRLTKQREVPPRLGLLLGRLLTASFIVGAAILAPTIGKFETIYVAIQTFLSLFQGPTLALLLLGIMWKRTNGWGAMAGLSFGLFVTITLNIVGSEVFPSGRPFLFVSFWSFWLTLAVTAIVSVLTPRPPEEKIRGLVYGSVLADPDAQALLQKRVNGET